MISEIDFIRNYTSFWRTISPLSEDFVKSINVLVLNRYETPLQSDVSSSRRALINELAFEVFSRSIINNKSVDAIVDAIEDISLEVSAYLSNLRTSSPQFNSELSVDEMEEISKLSHRLIAFFTSKKDIVIKPKFDGCGKLNHCFGDVFADGVLYEIKAGGRRFRSIDLRQLVVYNSLNQFSDKYEIKELGLYNPREGFHFKIDHNEFSKQFSGLTTSELTHRIIYEICYDEFVHMDEPCS